MPTESTAPQDYTLPTYRTATCRRCKGTGEYRGLGICFGCGGTGTCQIEDGGRRPMTAAERAARRAARESAAGLQVQA